MYNNTKLQPPSPPSSSSSPTSSETQLQQLLPSPEKPLSWTANQPWAQVRIHRALEGPLAHPTPENAFTPHPWDHIQYCTVQYRTVQVQVQYSTVHPTPGTIYHAAQYFPFPMPGTPHHSHV